MGAHILRTELRRSVAPWAATLIAAIGVFVLFASNPPYRSWMELAIVQRDVMQLTWPLALAAGAWQGIRERRAKVEELIETTPRPRWRRVLPIATAMSIATTTAYLAMFAGAIAHLRHPGAYFPAGAVVLVVLGALGMVAAAWLGQALGTLLPSPVTPPILVVIGFVAVSLLPSVVFNDADRPGTVLLFPSLRGPREGGFAVQMLSGRVTVLQALWLGAVAVTGLGLFAAARRGARVAALLPAALAAAIAVPALPHHVADAWVEDHRASGLVCTRDDPQVCITRAHSYALEYVSGPARDALSLLATRLPEAPTRVVVRDAGNGISPGPQPADEILVYVPIFDDVMTDYSPGNLLDMMLAGAGTRPCGNQDGFDPAKFTGEPPPQPNIRYEAARQAVAVWLVDKSPVPVTKGGSDGPTDPRERLVNDTLTSLRALPVDEQRARVAALRAAELTCAAGDRLDLLTGDGTQ